MTTTQDDGAPECCGGGDYYGHEPFCDCGAVLAERARAEEFRAALTRAERAEQALAAAGVERDEAVRDGLASRRERDAALVRADAAEAASNRRMVREFMLAVDQPVLPAPAVPADDRVRLRLRLIAEECFEVLRAQARGEQVFGTPIAAAGVPIYTDARHYSSAGIPTVLYGAGPRTLQEANGHGADECLRLRDLERATCVIALVLCDLMGGSRS